MPILILINIINLVIDEKLMALPPSLSSKNKSKGIVYLVKRTFTELNIHDPLLLSSSVAFFTLFSLPPILIIVINILSLVFRGRRINGEVFKTMSQIFGKSSTDQLHTITENFQKIGSNAFFTILGAIFLIFVATTTFSIIHKALNQIWQVRQKPQNSFINLLKFRAISLAIILGSGILFMVSLLIDGALIVLRNYLGYIFNKNSILLLKIIHEVFSVVWVTIWFAIIFKFLPDVKLKGKAIWMGALVTGCLFTLGKFVLGALLIKSNISTIYGAAGSIILLLLFLFYSSLILFFGAAFTKVYAEYKEYAIESKHFAVKYEISDLENESEKRI